MNQIYDQIKGQLKDPSYRKCYIKYLIWKEHIFRFPLRKIEKLQLKESTIIEMMDQFNQELRRYKRKSRNRNKKR